LRKSVVGATIALVSCLISMGLFSVNATANPRPFVIVDGKGDWFGAPGEPYTDIRLAQVIQKNSTHVKVVMMVDERIPLDPPTFMGFVWSFDMDKNGWWSTGPDLNVRVAYDIDFGWQAYLDRFDGNPGNIYTSLIVSKKRATVVLPLADLGTPSSFYWMATTVSANQELGEDQAPKYEPGFASWFSHP